jgi:hypothetical protein
VPESPSALSATARQTSPAVAPGDVPTSAVKLPPLNSPELDASTDPAGPALKVRRRLAPALKTVRGKLLAMLGLVITAAITTVVALAVHAVIDPSAPHKTPGPAHTHADPTQPPPVQQIRTRAVGNPTRAYRSPSLHGKSVAVFGPGESLAFTGYCIGAPVASLERGATDERWLIRADRTLVPAGQLSSFGMRSVPLPCPGKAVVGGPRLLGLTTHYSGNRTLIHATFARASLVGFALYNPTTKTWRQISQQIGRHASYTIALPGTGSAAVIAAACWAYNVPAHIQILSDFVALVRATSSTPQRLVARATGATPQGAQHACALPAETSSKVATRRERHANIVPPQSTTTHAPDYSAPPATTGQSKHTSPSTGPSKPYAEPAPEQQSS